MLQQSANTDTGTTTSQCPMKKINSISDNILDYIKNKLVKKYPDKKPLRAFHAKCIGLVKAEVKSLDNLDEDLKVGLFKTDKTYKAWVRFSNGAGEVLPDAKKAARGMAIKILDVESEEFIDPDPEGNTQDIILFTSRTHLPVTAGKQFAVPRVVLGTGLVRLIAIIMGLPRKLSAVKIFRQGQFKTPNILEETYYSATPYAFGKRIIKWQVRPFKTIASTMPEKPVFNFLTKRLIADLSEHSKEDITFGLFVQFHKDESTTPINDPSVLWKTPFHQVAVISIPKQKEIDTAERAAIDINMSFSPGHSMKEHEPLGDVNMIRRKVYGELSKERREHS